MIELLTEMGFVPLACVWELTLRCNLACLHCGSRAGAARDDELSLGEMLDVADQLVALGNQRTTLSGGEPLLRKGWPEIGRRLSDGGVAVNMITNGFAFGERQARDAVEAGLRNVGFSLDGDAPTHNRIRGHDEAHARVLRAIRTAQDAGLPVATVTHVIQDNIAQLEAMAETMVELGVGRWQVQLGFDFGNLSDHPELLVRPDQLREIVPLVARLKQTYAGTMAIDVGDDIGYYTEEEEVFRGASEPTGFWLGCRAGITVVGIEANGNVKGCLSMQDGRFVEGNLRHNTLAEIWGRDGAFAYTREFVPDQTGGFCRTCQYLKFCRGGCSWNGYLHGGKTGTFANEYCLYQVMARDGETAEGAGCAAAQADDPEAR